MYENLFEAALRRRRQLLGRGFWATSNNSAGAPSYLLRVRIWSGNNERTQATRVKTGLSILQRLTPLDAARGSAGQYNEARKQSLETIPGRFNFYLLPAFSLHAFSSAIEVLTLANEATRRNVYSWQVVSGDGQPVVSSCGITISSAVGLRSERDRNLRSNPAPVAIVCGGRSVPRHDSQLHSWLRECRNRRARLIGIGGGTLVLARAGVAEGRRCAVHWEQFPLFLEQFPGIIATQAAFEKDGELYTCSGGDASFDTFLDLVGCDYGAAVVNRICENAVACRVRTVGDRQRLPPNSRVRFNHKAVIEVIDQMEAHIGDPKSIDGLVAATGLTRRQIERLFKRELGRSPSRYYLELRLERAHLLLRSSNLPVIEIAVACGFVSASHFSKVYRDMYGCAPHQTRLLAHGAEQDRPYDPLADSPGDPAADRMITPATTMRAESAFHGGRP
ncbi:GlxA family transcriptional regulator [Mesorhizobium sp. M1006]|uniref:GlxA family transcriptional regulator n=1 Tax=Mesorhizobium sp. M1006 TaxID=2957048 RepID=UPI0033357FC5